ncbi:SDR family NAD(P)-dependent oxidoreductase [Rhodococcus sp. IEGM 1366]|nr:SDR family NAD(P)-dependent oxidoreductase [Rhodococcus sp. IEGM 1366]
MDNLNGKVAVVTGAASGIGRAMASVFGAAGMRVVLSDIAKDAVEAAAAELRADGVDCIAQVTDVADFDAVDALAQKSFETYGGVNVLCSNAGVSSIGKQWEISTDDWTWVMGADLWGPINGVRAFLPRMLDSNEPGHIVNTASLGGLMGSPFVGPYSVAKHGVVGLSRGLRLELGNTNINVSVLCPGQIATGIVPKMRERIADTNTDLSDDLNGVLDYLDTSLANSMDPLAVGEMVKAAILNNTFYILPNSAEIIEVIKADFEELIASVPAL